MTPSKLKSLEVIKHAEAFETAPRDQKHSKDYQKLQRRDLHTRTNKNSTNEKYNKDANLLLLYHAQNVDRNLMDKLINKPNVQLGKQPATTAADITTLQCLSPNKANFRTEEN